jgi:hypothetical protein
MCEDKVGYQRREETFTSYGVEIGHFVTSSQEHQKDIT